MSSPLRDTRVDLSQITRPDDPDQYGGMVFITSRMRPELRPGGSVRIHSLEVSSPMMAGSEEVLVQPPRLAGLSEPQPEVRASAPVSAVAAKDARPARDQAMDFSRVKPTPGQPKKNSTTGRLLREKRRESPAVVKMGMAALRMT